jgi:hypothetical protein
MGSRLRVCGEAGVGSEPAHGPQEVLQKACVNSCDDCRSASLALPREWPTSPGPLAFRARRVRPSVATSGIGQVWKLSHTGQSLRIAGAGRASSSIAFQAACPGQLDRHQVAGMHVRHFPDNSVVCHARRLAGFAQDVFVTGAALGVHCNSLPLSFFPDIYKQPPYDPSRMQIGLAGRSLER